MTKRDLDLDDAQVQSLMHQLRHEGESLREQWNEHDRAYAQGVLVGRLRHEILADPTLRPARRAGLNARLREAARGATADGPTLHGVDQLRIRAASADLQLHRRLLMHASRLGLTLAATRAQFDQLRASAPGGRRPRATAEQRATLTGLPTDFATRHALEELRRRGVDGHQAQRRVVTEWSDVGARPVQRVGYDRDSRRLEVRLSDGRLEAYRDVPSELADRASTASLAPAALLELRGDRGYHYSDGGTASAAGVAVPCDYCGRFTGSSHTCPVLQGAARVTGPVSRLSTSDEAMLMRVVDLEQTRVALREHDRVLVPVAARVPGVPGVYGLTRSPRNTGMIADSGVGTVRGDAVAVGAEAPQIDVRGLQCDCAQFRSHGRCRHVSTTARVLGEQLQHDPGRVGRLGDTYEAIAAEGRASREADGSHRHALAPDLSTVRYAEDPAAFAGDVRAALSSGAVPLLREHPAMYGYGADRAFGVEVEFTTDSAAVADASKQDKGIFEARSLGPRDLSAARVGHDLYAAGLTEQPEQQRYHAAKHEGYSSFYWSYEEDPSVAGEVVAPVLRDSPAAWSQLEQVCQIVRSHAGSPDDAGAHVTVSGADLGQRPDAVTKLLELSREYEDELYRLSATPGIRRALAENAAPVQAPPTLGYLDLAELRTATGRYEAVNVRGVIGDVDDKVELRLFDASLEPGRMQAQIKLATALVDYAARHCDEPAGPARVLGSWRAGVGSGLHPDAVDADTWAEQTANVRELVDRLFRRDVDKRQMAALWALGAYRELS